MSRPANVLKFPESRAWKAGDITTLLESWVSSAQPADVDIRRGLKALVARSRDAAQNNPHARHFIKLCSTNIIGRGVGYQCRAQLRNGKPDTRLADAMEEAYATFSEPGEFDVTGRHSRATFDRLLIETVARDGEALIRYLPWWDNQSRFAVQMIDPETLDIDYNDVLRNGNTVRMGVEMDEWRRPVAYHLRPESNPNGIGYRNTQRVRIDADEIEHVYLPEWAWQSRGVPWMAAGLQPAAMLNGYEDSAVTASRLSAAKMVFYKQTEPDAIALGEDEVSGSGSGAKDAEFVQDITPGLMEKLPFGWDVTSFDSGWPNIEHGAFVKAALRSIAAGWLINYNALSGDLEGVNYSSLREGSLRERDIWMCLQDWFVAAWHTRLFRRWMDQRIEAGMMIYPDGRPIPENKYREARRASWQPRRWPWVDPQKDMAANVEAVNLRIRSVSDIIREQGRDPDEVWREIAADQERMAELGITPAQALSASALQQSTEGAPDDAA